MSVKKTISFPDDLHSNIELHRSLTNRSYSNYVINAVTAYLKQQAGKYPELKIAMKIDAGNGK